MLQEERQSRLREAQQEASHPSRLWIWPMPVRGGLEHSLNHKLLSLLARACPWLRTPYLAQVIFFVPFLSITTDGSDATTDVYGIGKVMFIGIIGVVSWEIALISRYWTWIFMLVWALSYAVTFPFLWALGALFQALKVYDSTQVSVSVFLCCRRQCSALGHTRRSLSRTAC